MVRDRKPCGSIPRGRLGAELFRALRGAGAGKAPVGEGPPGNPEDLLHKLSGDLRAHLEVCEMCREEFEELATFLKYYAETLEKTVVDERFDVLANHPHPSTAQKVTSEDVWIELIYKPYILPFDETPQMAAATDAFEAESLRFCSGDKKYLLREYPECETRKPVYYLVGEGGVETANIEISIDGTIHSTDEDGRVVFGPGNIELTSESKILIKGGLGG